MTPQMVEEMVRKADKNGDGEMGRYEFEQLLGSFENEEAAK